MSSDSYQCTLTPELQDKAKNELNEDPEWRSKDVAALRDMVNKYTGLKCRTDDAFLLRFLRARKFDHQRAFDLLLNYFKKRKENPDIFENFTPLNLKHMFEAGVSNVLDCKDKLGRRIVLLRMGRWDPDRYPVT
ncbi:alpha-tocopherol transfer protein-like, partial [Lingula anatina]|uniref:Alpha-tocopherol transfer protein-like n=1 Tax=Lingula anatina TaxID=7574 RepID=A0A1S3IDQ0_LINAN